MDRFDRIFVAANRALVGGILAIAFAIVFANVVLRYGFGRSLSWAEEVARYLMVAGAYFGAGLALREGRLVAIDLFVEMLPARARIAARYAIAIMMIAFMAAIVWIGIRFAAFGYNKETMATQISRAIPYSVIPAGAALFIVHALLFMKRFARGEFQFDGADEADQSKDGDA